MLPCSCFAWLIVRHGLAIYRNKYLALEENISLSLYSLLQFLRNLSLTEYFKENPKRIRFEFPVTWIYIHKPTYILNNKYTLHYLLCRGPMATWGWARLTAWPRPVNTKPATAQLASLLRYREYKEYSTVLSTRSTVQYSVHRVQNHAEQHILSDASTDQCFLTGVSFNRIHYMHLQHHLQE